MLLILLFAGIFAFIAASPQELTQTLLMCAWILGGLMALVPFVQLIARAL